jgi:hypothetical protein
MLLILLALLTLGLVAGGSCEIGGGDDVDVFRLLIQE